MRSTVFSAGLGGVAGAVAAQVDIDGSGASRHARELAGKRAVTRDLADAVHLVCLLHGTAPGVLDHAKRTDPASGAGDWLSDAATAFSAERALVAQLAAAAGPLPSTPGQAESEAAVQAQRHALEMLARSDRMGCALGAAVALVLDWPAVRSVLESAATRFGLEPAAAVLPPPVETLTLVAALGSPAPVERAMMFGAQQLLAQHRGLWALLDARAAARDH